MFEMHQIAANSKDWFVWKLTVEDTQHISIHDIEKERAEGLISEDLIQQEYFCFTPEQSVLLPHGVKPIAEIKPDDVVISHAGRIRKVEKVWEREYEGDLIEISSFGSSEIIRCTPNHPIRVYSRGDQTYTWKQAGELTLDDRLVFPKYDLGEYPVISYELCMLLAWYICDGSAAKNLLQFTVRESKSVRIIELLTALKIPYTLHLKSSVVNIVINSVQLVDFFRSTCGLKSYDKRIPLNLISTHERDFLYELFKGDGCYSESKGMWKHTFTTTSKHLAYQIQILANSINEGLAVGISRRQGGSVVFPGRGKECKTLDSYHLGINSLRLRERSSALLRAKYGIAAIIKEINRVPYSGKVYNLQVQYDESYIVAGRAVHNCSYEMGVEGAYYAKYLDRMRVANRITTVPWESGFKVHTAWDLGVRDSTSIVFFQTIGQTVRLIDYYENAKMGLEHYAKILAEKPYQYGKHIAPHDIAVQEFGSGITRIEKAKQLGIQFTIAPSCTIEDGIETVRSTFSKMWIDEHTCKQLIKALENYRQEFDAKKKVYKGYPLHNWASHACFTGDTLLLTRNGMRRIMDIQDSEEVLTLNGYQKCTAARKTKTFADIVEVIFQDGTKVKCTPDHLFLTENGWKSAEYLTPNTVIQSSLTSLHNTLMEAFIEYGRMRDIFLKEEQPFTGLCGGQLLEKYRKIVIYITETLIPSITTCGTWNVSLLRSILGFRGLMRRDLATLLEILQRNGIDPRLEGCGIKDMLNDLNLGLNGSENHENVSTAKKSMTALFEEMAMHKNSVIQTVRPITIESVNLLKEKSDVWDITVPVIGHFSLENGAIVHNSDAVRYLCISLPKTRDGLSPQELEKRYNEAMYGNQSNLPAVFRDDGPKY